MMPSSDKMKFLDPKTLVEAAYQIKTIADNNNTRIALIGGFALQFYGSDRLTGDIDIVADDKIDQFEPLDILSFGGIRTVAPNGTPTDIIIRNDDYKPLYDEALLFASPNLESPIPIVQAEYLAAMKMVAGRGKDSTDLEFLIETHILDIIKTKEIIKRHLGIYAVHEFEAIVDEVEWKASKKK